MEHTKETIDAIKSNPVMQLLSLFSGKTIDELVSEIEKEHFSSNDNLNAPNKSITGVLKPTKEHTRVFPIGKDEYAFIVKSVTELNNNIAKAKQLGFSDIDTKDLTLVGAPLSIIYTLLRNLVNADFAGKFVLGVPNKGTEYFWKIYDEQTKLC